MTKLLTEMQSIYEKVKKLEEDNTELVRALKIIMHESEDEDCWQYKTAESALIKVGEV